MSKNALPDDHQTRLERARLSLEGLSIGDAFGERFIWPWRPLVEALSQRISPPPPWPYTDDTAMALGIVEVLLQTGEIDQNRLAATFARNYVREPHRGYGGMAHRILQQIDSGEDWKRVSGRAFNGMGSMGNGGAMRVAPVGAYFADDLAKAAEQARLSAQVTHAHGEGQAGAMAVAVAAGWAWSIRDRLSPDCGPGLVQTALQYTPKGPTRAGIERALSLSLNASVDEAVASLGNGTQVTAPDTVPFALWCAARHIDNFEEALWTTVSGLGDCDTTCAMVGGIVILCHGRKSIPSAWLQAREPLPSLP